MAKGFTINGTDFDDLFEPTRAGFNTVTFTGLSPECTYMARTGDASNPNADGYYNYNGTPYDAHPKGYKIPKSLSYSGTWGTQTEGSAVNTSGITFTVTYQDGTTASVTPSVSPSSWATDSGSQTATFSYTYHGVTVSTTKTCGMTYSVTVSSGGNGTCSGSTTYTYSSSSQTKSISYSPNSGYTFSYWSVSGGSASASGTTLTINGGSRGNITVTGYFKIDAVLITLTNPNSGLAFRSISGNLYTNSSCTTKAVTKKKYNVKTFYYKSNETKPTGSYLYNYGDGEPSTSDPSSDTLTTYYNEGSLTACLGTSGYCWAGTKKTEHTWYRMRLSNGAWTYTNGDAHRVRELTF